VPGPGHYSKINSHKGPEYTIGEKHTECEDKNRANDRFYEVDDAINYTKGKNPSANFGDSKRTDGRTDQYPGPGYYVKPEFDKGPAYTIASKYDDRGPSNENYAFYNVDDGFNATQPNPRNTFVEKSERKDEFQNKYPGPGMYNVTQSKIGGITMGEKLGPTAERFRAPGPGAYKPSWDEASINYTHDIKMGKAEKLPDEKHADYPGPGFYKVKCPWDKGPVIGTGERTKFDSSETPGPSYYDVPAMVPVIYSVNKPKIVP